MSETDRVDASHPWPWLDPYTERAHNAFGGRNDDVQALLRGVLAAPVCVLFGRSGLGKTSLLLAGLFPELRKRQLLPVAVRRLEHGAGALSVSAQLLRALLAAASEAALRWARPPVADVNAGDVAALWEHLHERGQSLLDAGGRSWTPVFVLDQFEEIFTLEPDDRRRRQVFQELGDLLENRVPPAVASRIDLDEALLDRIDLDQQPYRFLLSLREDFLPELEYWSDLIPRLGPNRYRLLPLSDDNAIAAICKTGGALVDRESATQIVQFLVRQASQSGRTREERRIEPALLSLVCASLNADRLASRPPGTKLDVSNLETRGAQILDRFYDDAYRVLEEPLRTAAQEWIEANLITPGGSRRPYPLNAVEPALAEALAKLEQQRLLRTEPTEQGNLVELVHDRLAGVARQRALATQRRTAEAARLRSEKEAAETELLRQRAAMGEIERQRAQDAELAAERARTLTRGVAAIAVVALILAAASVYFAVSAERERRAARKAAQQKEEALADARRDAETATAALAQSREAARKASEALELARRAAYASRTPREQGAEARALLVEADKSLAGAYYEVKQLESCPAGRRVYPHLARGTDASILERPAAALRAAGFIVPAVQMMPPNRMPSTTDVRYFRKNDKDGADAAAAALSGTGLGKVSPRFVAGFELSRKVRPCHYELWVAPTASAY
jgi:conflict system STAND superfamily ATPase